MTDWFFVLWLRRQRWYRELRARMCEAGIVHDPVVFENGKQVCVWCERTLRTGYYRYDEDGYGIPILDGENGAEDAAVDPLDSSPPEPGMPEPGLVLETQDEPVHETGDVRPDYMARREKALRVVRPDAQPMSPGPKKWKNN